MTDLKHISKQIRKYILKTVYNAGAGHLGGSLSSVEIMASLYFKQMSIDPNNPYWEDRDRFVMSKGHATPLYYSTLALRGYFDIEELFTFDSINSRLQAHPDMALLPGVDFSTGSLGQGISGAVGMALSAKLTGKDYKVYCLVGDGESQEGQFWEALDFASKYKLDNLIVIIDINGLQQYGFNNVDDKMDSPIKNPYSRCKTFGMQVDVVDGHNIEDINNTFEYLKEYKQDKPTVILSHTIKGAGISFMEDNYLWHSKPMTDEEYSKALEELI